MNEKLHARAPIVDTLRKSPFIGLQEHFNYVKVGTIALKNSVKYYLDKDYDNFKKYAQKVYQYEQDGDWIKGNIRNHLPNFIFIPVDKGDFLMLLKETDGILDTAEDIAVLMDMRKTKVPKEVKKDFQAVLKKALTTVETLGKAMEMLKIMLEVSFGGRLREDIKRVIHRIHKLEHDSDVIEKKISKELFNNKELDSISIIHLLKIVDRLGCIADHAENAADRIRAMVAK